MQSNRLNRAVGILRCQRPDATGYSERIRAAQTHYSTQSEKWTETPPAAQPACAAQAQHPLARTHLEHFSVRLPLAQARSDTGQATEKCSKRAVHLQMNACDVLNAS